MGEVLNKMSEKHLPFWGRLPFLRESCDTGRMGARECLRSERTQSLLCAGGQGVRVHGVLYSEQRATELNKGLGVAVKRRREAPPMVLSEVLPGQGSSRERKNRVT
jgi:hypothetical protein